MMFRCSGEGRECRERGSTQSQVKLPKYLHNALITSSIVIHCDPLRRIYKTLTRSKDEGASGGFEIKENNPTPLQYGSVQRGEWTLEDPRNNNNNGDTRP